MQTIKELNAHRMEMYQCLRYLEFARTKVASRELHAWEVQRTRVSCARDDAGDGRCVALSIFARTRANTCGKSAGDAGEKKGNLVIKQLHLLHLSEHLNARAALSMRAFYLSRIKVRSPLAVETSVFFRFSRRKIELGKYFHKSETKECKFEKFFFFKRRVCESPKS